MGGAEKTRRERERESVCVIVCGCDRSKEEAFSRDFFSKSVSISGASFARSRGLMSRPLRTTSK